jgi:hypothetical protein
MSHRAKPKFFSHRGQFQAAARGPVMRASPLQINTIMGTTELIAFPKPNRVRD